jgi:hypothetical protein
MHVFVAVPALYLLLLCGGAPGQTPSPPTTFDWGQRWHYYVYRTYSWQRLSILSAETVWDHMMREPREWDREADSYGYRLGAALGRRMVRNTIELGAGAALGEDTRFRASGNRAFGSRIRYAFIQAFTAYDRDGKRRFGYSRLAGTMGGMAVISCWGPQPFGAQQYFERVGFDFLGHLENSFLSEFGDDMKAVGRSVRKKVFRK